MDKLVEDSGGFVRYSEVSFIGRFHRNNVIQNEI